MEVSFRVSHITVLPDLLSILRADQLVCFIQIKTTIQLSFTLSSFAINSSSDTKNTHDLLMTNLSA